MSSSFPSQQGLRRLDFLCTGLYARSAGLKVFYEGIILTGKSQKKKILDEDSEEPESLFGTELQNELARAIHLLHSSIDNAEGLLSPLTPIRQKLLLSPDTAVPLLQLECPQLFGLQLCHYIRCDVHAYPVIGVLSDYK